MEAIPIDEDFVLKYKEKLLNCQIHSLINTYLSRITALITELETRESDYERISKRFKQKFNVDIDAAIPQEYESLDTQS